MFIENQSISVLTWTVVWHHFVVQYCGGKRRRNIDWSWSFFLMKYPRMAIYGWRGWSECPQALKKNYSPQTVYSDIEIFVIIVDDNKQEKQYLEEKIKQSQGYPGKGYNLK